MKKTFWQKLTTPIGYESEYEWWSAKINKGLEKSKCRSPKYMIIEINKLKGSLPKGLTSLTKEQKDELIKRCDDFLLAQLKFEN